MVLTLMDFSVSVSFACIFAAGTILLSASASLLMVRKYNKAVKLIIPGILIYFVGFVLLMNYIL